MIVVCGEALMDVFGSGDTPSGMTLDARVGGSPFNVAVGLARLAQPVCFLASLSRDFLGERLMRALRDEGVDTTTVTRVDAPTTLGLVGMDAQGVPSYAFYGHGGADRQVGLDALERLPANISAVHLGSFSTVVEPVANTLRALVDRAHASTLISYDPNVRLNVEPNLAHWRLLLDWMLPRTHLLKISEEDLNILRPGESIEQFCDAALQQGVKLVVVTRGQSGAMGRSAASPVAYVPPAVVKTIDTVGAGDTFQVALMTWMAEQDCLSADALAALDEDGLRAALAFAARAAAITCSRRGADLPRRGELN